MLLVTPFHWQERCMQADYFVSMLDFEWAEKVLAGERNA